MNIILGGITILVLNQSERKSGLILYGLKGSQGTMKMIDFTKITACGECCIGCEKKLTGICEGCIESDGHCKEWTQSKGCPIHKCAKEHNVQFCGLCAEFPCEWLPQKVSWNPNIVDDLNKLTKMYKQQIAEGANMKQDSSADS